MQHRARGFPEGLGPSAELLPPLAVLLLCQLLQQPGDGGGNNVQRCTDGGPSVGRLNEVCRSGARTLLEDTPRQVLVDVSAAAQQVMDPAVEAQRVTSSAPISFLNSSI